MKCLHGDACMVRVACMAGFKGCELTACLHMQSCHVAGLGVCEMYNNGTRGEVRWVLSAWGRVRWSCHASSTLAHR